MSSLILDTTATAILNILLFGATLQATWLLMLLQTITHGLIHLATEPSLLSNGRWPKPWWKKIDYTLTNLLKTATFGTIFYVLCHMIFGLQMDMLIGTCAFLSLYALYRFFRPLPSKHEHMPKWYEYAGSLMIRNIIVCILFTDVLTPIIPQLAHTLAPIATHFIPPVYTALIYLALTLSAVLNTLRYALYRHSIQNDETNSEQRPADAFKKGDQRSNRQAIKERIKQEHNLTTPQQGPIHNNV